jgi:hypothetical protein
MIFANKKSSQLSFRGQGRVGLVCLTFLLTFSLCGFELIGIPARTCSAHIYKDGFVERSMSITIRGESGHGELLIGLNKTTAASILADAKLAQARSDSKPPKKAQGQSIDSDGLEPVSGKVAEQNSKTDAAVKLNRKQRETNSASRPNSIGKANSATLDSLNDNAIIKAGEGQHLTDPAMIKQLAGLKEYWALKKLKLTLNGRRVKVANVSVAPAPRHPYSMVLKFDFALDSPSSNLTADDQSDRIRLRLLDQTFPRQNGAVRYSLRSRGSTILLKSNVAPVIVRAERFEFMKTRNRIDSTSFTIDATLIVDR